MARQVGISDRQRRDTVLPFLVSPLIVEWDVGWGCLLCYIRKPRRDSCSCFGVHLHFISLARPVYRPHWHRVTIYKTLYRKVGSLLQLPSLEVELIEEENRDPERAVAIKRNRKIPLKLFLLDWG